VSSFDKSDARVPGASDITNPASRQHSCNNVRDIEDGSTLRFQSWVDRSDVDHAVHRTLLPRRGFGHDSAPTLQAHREAPCKGFIGTEPNFAGQGPGRSSEHCSLRNLLLILIAVVASLVRS
jgi:hypothetical protein